jgi:hypothetical protein
MTIVDLDILICMTLFYITTLNIFKNKKNKSCPFEESFGKKSFIKKIIFFFQNRIGGVMVSVLASSAVDRGFEPQSGQTKDLMILVFVASPLSTQH